MRCMCHMIPPNYEFKNLFVNMSSIQVAVDSVTLVGLGIKEINPLLYIISLKSPVAPCKSTFRRSIL